MTTILFDAHDRSLGQFTFHEGALVRSVLSPRGDRSLKKTVSLWPKEGIPVPVRQITVRDRKRTVAVGAKVVGAKDKTAHQAFLAWASGNGYVTFELLPELTSRWEQLLSLPLTSGERLMILQSMSSISKPLMQTWAKALDKVMTRITSMSTRS